VSRKGWGKNVLANLVLRLYDVVGGDVKMDCADILEYKVKALRKQICIVIQETLILPASIDNNILDRDDQADLEKERQVRLLANGLQFIELNIEVIQKEEGHRDIVEQFMAKVKALSQNNP
jgi:ABC-type bacteriocin/lantibiotic exporter with double-glycine peptidase domain